MMYNEGNPSPKPAASQVKQDWRKGCVATGRHHRWAAVRPLRISTIGSSLFRPN